MIVVLDIYRPEGLVHMERPTPYRVSTITCNGDVGAPVNLRAFYEHVKVVPRGSGGGWIFVEFSLAESRGMDPNQKRRENMNRKNFVNQVTVIYDFGGNYMPNIKLFKNGNVHMTGIRSLADGQRVVELLAEEVQRIAAECDPTVAEVDKVRAGEFKCRMINCDFTAPFRIRRKDLHNMLIAPPYNNISNFQPGTYPGVKIHYFWNAHARHERHGRCECIHRGADSMCLGKGAGDGVGACKKVTIAVFESGKVLITGATSIEQVDAAYDFICGTLMQQAARLQKILQEPPVAAPAHGTASAASAK